MKKIISVMMLLVMVVSLFTIGHATPEIGSMAIEPEQTSEVLELREKNSETYRLEDGSYECVVFAEDKYFEDETGKLVEISNTVVPEKHTIAGKEYGFTNEANSNRIYFSENEPSVLVSTGKQDLAFNIVTDRAVTPVIGGLKDVGEIAEYSLSGDTCFAYMNAFEHTDLVYKVRNGMLKEYIVLNDASAPREFTFTFGTVGYTVAYTEYGTVGFYDGEGELVFELGNLFAVDSADALTDELAYTIGETIEGKTEITVTLSEDYAADPARAYPILVDPSVMVTGTYDTYDSFVSSKNPTENYYHDEHIRMGWNSGYNIRRTYISFELPSSVPSNAITTAYMSLKKYGAGSTPSLKAYRVTGSWTSSTITWNNKPSYSTLYASDTAEPKTNNWYRFYVTDIVKKWYAGTYQNYGFLVKDADESGTSSWSTFYSSDADSPNKPELRIRYQLTSYYSSMYIGAYDGDSLMPGILNAVASAYNANEYYGYDHTSITKSVLINELKNIHVFSAITHGAQDRIRLTNNYTFTISDVSAISSSDLTDLAFVYFGACETGKGGASATNLVNAVYSKGVDVVIGFQISVLIDETNFWTEILMTEIADGESVSSAISTADYEINNDPVLGGRTSYTISNRLVRGNTSTIPCP